ncbi:transcriptional repressor [Profundibacterium mesophilum]|uniref:Zinc-uptake regulator Zur n=1 Tax=Profundibacterium mesophilum KAUST100406-0324 TaxID=1037889 RepID=A0A921NZJ2_9RHOB|nr:transcriptional repressor [Profundibacterium mesophilum]KAF0677529.1 Zinc-uptake regulator Zur [Profundibacterium mesophilum KAUST100406-0324]
MPPTVFQTHDHAACITGALHAAQRICEDGGVRLTPVRRRVLELLLCDHKAMGAYEILARLRDEGLGSQPPAVYRALDFLGRHGLVHKVEKINAFVACIRPGVRHAPAFLICRGCDAVSEEVAARGAGAPLSPAAAASGFEVETLVVEAIGLCPACRMPDSDGVPAGQADT